MKALLLLALMPAAAFAGIGFSVDWEHPTHNVDESEIPSTGDLAIGHTLVEWGSCNGDLFGKSLGSRPIAYPARTVRIDNDNLEPDRDPLLEGTTYCVRAFTENRKGRRSDSSEVVYKTATRP